MRKTVREPIQTYLTEDERAGLDRLASELGISRSEALRRGVSLLRRADRAGTLGDLAEIGLVTPAATGPGAPPPAAPVAPLDAILCELEQDRQER